MEELFNEFLISAFHGEINVDITIKTINPENVFKAVCYLVDKDKGEIERNTRLSSVVKYRQIAHYFAREVCNKTPLAIIGKKIGNKDHATVLHSIKVVQNYIDTDRNYRDMIGKLRIGLKQIL